MPKRLDNSAVTPGINFDGNATITTESAVTAILPDQVRVSDSYRELLNVCMTQRRGPLQRNTGLGRFNFAMRTLDMVYKKRSTDWIWDSTHESQIPNKKDTP